MQEVESHQTDLLDANPQLHHRYSLFLSSPFTVTGAYIGTHGFISSISSIITVCPNSFPQTTMKESSNPKDEVKFSEQEILGLLKPVALKQYKALEDSIRNVYSEIASLELPEIDPSQIDAILGRKDKDIQPNSNKGVKDSVPPMKKSDKSRASTAKSNRKLERGNFLASILKDKPEECVLKEPYFDRSAIKRLIRDNDDSNEKPRNIFSGPLASDIAELEQEPPRWTSKPVALPAETEKCQSDIGTTGIASNCIARLFLNPIHHITHFHRSSKRNPKEG